MELLTNPLSLMILLPAAAGLALLALPERFAGAAAPLGAAAAFASLCVAARLWLGFDPAVTAMQFGLDRPWLPYFGITYSLGIDGLSLALIILAALLTAAGALASFGQIKESRPAFYGCLLLTEAALAGVFAARDLFVFYLFWEAMLVPMYFLVGVWGGERRVHAAVKFFVYTVAGSALMLAAMLWLAAARHAAAGAWSFRITDLCGAAGPAQGALFAAFALAFAVKVPLIPLHTWLPDAHAEAPTAGSVLLAGLLLKTGVYGFIRIGVPLFPQAAAAAAPWLAGAGAAGVIYASLAAWRQRDIKRLIAYSSIAHLGLVVVGIMSFDLTAVSGAALQMFNHGVSTGALFLLAGLLHERRHTRLIEDYGGLAASVPAFAAVFLVTALSSIGLPGLNGFVGEALVLFGSFRVYPWAAAAALSGVVLSAVYMLGLYQQVFFGPLRRTENRVIADLRPREWACLLPLLALMFYVGLKPGALLRRLEPAAASYIESARPGALPPAAPKEGK